MTNESKVRIAELEKQTEEKRIKNEASCTCVGRK